jgi:hypothetical protein
MTMAACPFVQVTSAECADTTPGRASADRTRAATASQPALRNVEARPRLHGSMFMDLPDPHTGAAKNDRR